MMFTSSWSDCVILTGTVSSPGLSHALLVHIMIVRLLIEHPTINTESNFSEENNIPACKIRIYFVPASVLVLGQPEGLPGGVEATAARHCSLLPVPGAVATAVHLAVHLQLLVQAQAERNVSEIPQLVLLRVAPQNQNLNISCLSYIVLIYILLGS